MASGRTVGSSWMQVLVKGAMSFIIAVLLWEVVARNYVSFSLPRVTLENGARVNNGSIVQWDEGFSQTRFDSEGLRSSPPVTAPKLKILTLGDSYTEALQVGDSETFSSKIHSYLESKGVEAEVDNAGMSGASPPRYIALADYYKQKLNPDWVVVQINDDDFTSDFRSKKGDFYAQAAGEAFEIVHSKEAAKEKSDSLPKKAINLVTTLSVGQIALKKAQAALEGEGGPKKKKDPVEEAKLMAESKRYMAWCIGELKAKYPRLIMVYVPGIAYFDLSKGALEMEQAISEECARQGVELVNTRDAFVERYKKTGEVSHGFLNTSAGKGHINALGHDLVGKAVADRILRSSTK